MAKIDNGARTRNADMFHGLFLLAFVLLPALIHRIPLAALGAMLVSTGLIYLLWDVDVLTGPVEYRVLGEKPQTKHISGRPARLPTRSPAGDVLRPFEGQASPCRPSLEGDAVRHCSCEV